MVFNTILKTENLTVEYTTNKSIFGEKVVIHAVNGISLEIQKGEILAIAGESGCGKSTLAKAIIGLEPAKSGRIVFNGQNIFSLTKKQLKELRQHIQMVFQNPYASLNPKMKIGEILKEPLEIKTNLSKSEILNIVKDKIKLVGLSENCLDLYPHEFSGGQRQRIAIARALVLNPEFILERNPDIIMIIGSYWPKKPTSMRLGFDTNEAKSQELLKAFTTERQGWAELKAVQSKNVYSTHHGLPREVYDVAVFEYLAKTFYPEEFKDVDPEGTLKEFYDKFLPFSYGGVWFMHLN